MARLLVRLAGIEPACPKARDFKSLVSTYFTTVAFKIWCPNRDSNSDAEAVASKTTVSTNSTIGANF